MIKEKLVSVLPVSLIDWFMDKVEKDPLKIEKTLPKLSPELLEIIGRKRAIEIFRFANNNVRHYQAFLSRHRIDPSKVVSFDDFVSSVPELDKGSYIKTAHNFHDLFSSSNIDHISIIFESSGHTGKPTLWAKDRSEEDKDRKRAAVALDLLFKTYKYNTLFVNSFALGSWVTGIELSRIADSHCTIINPGANDDDILKIIRNFNDMFDQIIVAGYPPFVKNLLERGKDEGIDFKKINLNFMLGGEAMPENLRDKIYELIGKKINYKDKKGNVYSGFGASDIGVVGATETFESVYIRKLSSKNSKLAKLLFKQTTNIPMIFQYNPIKYHIYTNSNGELIFTILEKSILPLVKYNLKDIGGVVSYNGMKSVLKECNIDMDIQLPFPFVYVYGRSDGAVNFYGSIIYPTLMQEIFLEDNQIKGKITGDFRLDVTYDKKGNPFLQIEVQLKEGITPTKGIERNIHGLFKKELFNKVLDFKPKRKYFEGHYSKKGFVIIKVYSFDKYPYKGLKFKYH